MIRVVSRNRILIFTHPGSRIQGSKMHRIPDPDPQHCPQTRHLPPFRIFDAFLIQIFKGICTMDFHYYTKELYVFLFAVAQLRFSRVAYRRSEPEAYLAAGGGGGGAMIT